MPAREMGDAEAAGAQPFAGWASNPGRGSESGAGLGGGASSPGRGFESGAGLGGGAAGLGRGLGSALSGLSGPALLSALALPLCLQALGLPFPFPFSNPRSPGLGRTRGPGCSARPQLVPGPRRGGASLMLGKTEGGRRRGRQRMRRLEGITTQWT